MSAAPAASSTTRPIAARCDRFVIVHAPPRLVRAAHAVRAVRLLVRAARADRTPDPLRQRLVADDLHRRRLLTLFRRARPRRALQRQRRIREPGHDERKKMDRNRKSTAAFLLKRSPFPPMMPYNSECRSSSMDIRRLYDRFYAPLMALDCGRMCAPHNPSGKPFCCDICHAVPAAHPAEWAYLQRSTDLWHIWRGDECSEDSGDPAVLQAETPEHMLLLACKGPAHCQRNFRLLSCRSSHSSPTSPMTCVSWAWPTSGSSSLPAG